MSGRGQLLWDQHFVVSVRIFWTSAAVEAGSKGVRYRSQTISDARYVIKVRKWGFDGRVPAPYSPQSTTTLSLPREQVS